MANLEDLEKRLRALEQAVAQLRQPAQRPLVEETLAEQGARLLREAKASQAARNSCGRRNGLCRHGHPR